MRKAIEEDKLTAKIKRLVRIQFFVIYLYRQR